MGASAVHATRTACPRLHVGRLASPRLARVHVASAVRPTPGHEHRTAPGRNNRMWMVCRANVKRTAIVTRDTITAEIIQAAWSSRSDPSHVHGIIWSCSLVSIFFMSKKESLRTCVL